MTTGALDTETCYRALATRDRRFDGRFFTAVKTTGIYCRPVCPARTPRLANVRFFACAAAAEEAGFRACLRCRPESAPGSPAWLGTSVTVKRAVRLILDGVPVTELAVGVGARHLRRLFLQEIGVSPLRLSLSRRVHFARELLDQTDLPVTEVAHGAGFGSVRRFNDAFKKSFGRPPSAVRRGGAPAGLCLRIAHREPYDRAAILGFYAARAIPGVEVVSEDAYRRTIAWEGGSGVLAVSFVPGGLEVRVPAGAARGLLGIVARVRRMFDCDADEDAIASCLSRDPGLAPLVARRPGLRVPGAWDAFELVVRAILGQQVSVAGARTLAGKLVSELGESVAGAPGLERLFPTPAALARVAWRGVPAVRGAAIRAVAEAVAGGLVLDSGARPALAAIPGIGPWTLEYVALRAFGEPDAFPAGDLVLRRALGGELSERALTARAERWRPWRAYAALQLWTGTTKEKVDESRPDRITPGRDRVRRP
jgi:AraC family transcriptional regulator of adaptative response / DNA-3-methyladenine glycosylase II